MRAALPSEGRTQTTLSLTRFTFPPRVYVPRVCASALRVYHMLHGHEINVKEQSSSERRALLVIPQDFF